jgi:hypothetical protein
MAERTEACPEWRDDLAGWLVAQIPPHREELLRAHLATCEGCRTEADSLLAVSAVSLAADLDRTAVGDGEPPVELGHRIVASIASERRARRRLRTGMAALAGAAAVVVAVVLVADDDGPGRVRGEEVAFTLVPAGATVDAVIAEEGNGTLVQLTATGLDPDVTYALWLSPPDGTWDDRVAAGTFRPDADGDVDVRLRCALPADEYGRAWATTPEGEIALDTK